MRGHGAWAAATLAGALLAGCFDDPVAEPLPSLVFGSFASQTERAVTGEVFSLVRGSVEGNGLELVVVTVVADDEPCELSAEGWTSAPFLASVDLNLGSIDGSQRFEAALEWQTEPTDILPQAYSIWASARAANVEAPAQSDCSTA